MQAYMVSGIVSMSGAHGTDSLACNLQTCPGCDQWTQPPAIYSMHSIRALQDIEEHLRQYLSGRAIPHADAAIPIDPQAEPFLAGNIDEVRVCDTEFYAGIPVGCKLMDWQVRLPPGPLEFQCMLKNVHGQPYLSFLDTWRPT